MRRGPAQEDRSSLLAPRVVCPVRLACAPALPGAARPLSPLSLALGAAQTSARTAGITTFARAALARGIARRSTSAGRARARCQDGAVASAESAWRPMLICSRRSAATRFSFGQQSCDARSRKVPSRVRFRRHGRRSEAGVPRRLSSAGSAGLEREELAAACNFTWPCRSACSPDLRQGAIGAKLHDRSRLRAGPRVRRPARPISPTRRLLGPPPEQASIHALSDRLLILRGGHRRQICARRGACPVRRSRAGKG